MNKSNPIWILAMIIILLLFVVNVVLFVERYEYDEKLTSLSIKNFNNSLFSKKTETGKECPDAEGGLKNAYIHVKYFYSKFCPWCIKEEPILQKLVEDYGNLIHVEWYNINSCSELVEKYKISGVPTFVFNTYDDQKEYSHYGFIPKKDLMKLMCDVTGEC